MTNKIKYGLSTLIVVLISAYFGLSYSEQQLKSETTVHDSTQQQGTIEKQHKAADEIAAAFAQGLSDVQVQSEGEVIAVLPDDNEGSRHQKFILKLSSGQTVLVSHNIDLAPRIPNLQKGDRVEFYGEYEYSDKGGVIHWTHHDPAQRHSDGWLKHHNKIYQ